MSPLLDRLRGVNEGLAMFEKWQMQSGWPHGNSDARSILKRCGFSLASGLFLFLIGCLHARVELAPALIPPGRQQKNEYTDGTADFRRERDRVVAKQHYYLWGFLPREHTYDEGILCPTRGIKEIHQFSTFADLLVEQLTIGIYSPRTIEVLCHRGI